MASWVQLLSWLLLQLASAEEFEGESFSGSLGEILIRYLHSVLRITCEQCFDSGACRCNNVLYLRGAPEEDEDMT